LKELSRTVDEKSRVARRLAATMQELETGLAEAEEEHKDEVARLTREHESALMKAHSELEDSRAEFKLRLEAL